MTDAPPQREDTPTRERKRDMAAKLWKQGLSEGESRLKQALGLGQTPNVVPESTPQVKDAPRTVLVGWHPVGGLAGKWFAEQTGLGKLITEKINQYPDPTQHWAVIVGDYVHQLWMDEKFDVIYTNQKVVIEEWQTFTVGHTRFNDDAVRRTGETVIAQIREKQPAYNLISNNCQTYALRLLDAIKADGPTQFPTTHEVYKALVGPGAVLDLFKPDDATAEQPPPPPGQAGQQPADQPKPEESVSMAQKLMNQYTSLLSPKETDQKEKSEIKEAVAAEAEVVQGGAEDATSGNSPDTEMKKKNKVGAFFSRVARLGK